MKEKKAKSKAQIATEAARDALRHAKVKLAAKETEENKKAVVHAKAKLADVLAVENRERFLNLGGLRFGKVITALEVLSNVANRKGYKFDKDDIDEAFGAVNEKVKVVRALFDAELAPSAAKTESGEKKSAFSFSKK
jgi:hypothetical protein